MIVPRDGGHDRGRVTLPLGSTAEPLRLSPGRRDRWGEFDDDAGHERKKQGADEDLPSRASG